MQYEVTNKIFGTKMTLISDKHKEQFFASCKKDKKGQIDWFVSQELPDAPVKKGFSVEELKKMLAEAEEQEAFVVEEKPQRGRPKKVETNE